MWPWCCLDSPGLSISLWSGRPTLVKKDLSAFPTLVMKALSDLKALPDFPTLVIKALSDLPFLFIIRSTDLPTLVMKALLALPTLVMKALSDRPGLSRVSWSTCLSCNSWPALPILVRSSLSLLAALPILVMKALSDLFCPPPPCSVGLSRLKTNWVIHSEILFLSFRI